jgi:hypothetical protein
MDIDQANTAAVAADQATGIMAWLDKLDPSDWVNLGGVIAATFIGAMLAYMTTRWQESRRDAQLQRALKAALLAEVETCISRAHTYLSENIVAPAYRMPVSVHESAFTQFISAGGMPSGRDVRAVIEFHQQVQQINFLLDEIHRHLPDGLHPGGRAMQERTRLIAKLQEMNEPGTRFYDPVMRALGGPVNTLPDLDERAQQRG